MESGEPAEAAADGPNGLQIRFEVFGRTDEGVSRFPEMPRQARAWHRGNTAEGLDSARPNAAPTHSDQNADGRGAPVFFMVGNSSVRALPEPVGCAGTGTSLRGLLEQCWIKPVGAVEPVAEGSPELWFG